MANMRAIRNRIKSIESTRQITKSMKMVAAAKRRRTQLSVGNLKSFSDKSRFILSHLMGSMTETENPFLKARLEVRKRCYVLFVGNRGLCGVYNSSLLRYAEEQAAADGGECFAVVCGRWGKDSFASSGLNVRRVFDDISDTPSAQESRELTDYLKQLYLSNEADEIVLVYQQFRSVLSQTPGRMTLLPVPPMKGEGSKEYIFEPDKNTVLDSLVELYISNTVYSVMLEAKTGEHAARMTAMTAATDNTEELISSLTLELNHARQSAITTEISEIVGGSAMMQQQ